MTAVLREHSARVLWQKQRRGGIAEAAEKGAVAILPTGAIEQHGPHLPIDTDSFTAFEIAARAAEEIAEFPVLVLPPVWWGLSPYWMRLPGTITIRPEILMELLVDVCHSAAQHGIRKLVMLNGHGGNNGLIQAAAVKGTLPRLRVATVSYWSLIPDELRRVSERDGGGIGHSGELESSIQLYLQPELVDMQAVTPEQCTPLAATPPAAYMAPDVGADASRTVFGYAPAATAEKGERIVNAAAEALAAFIRTFRADEVAID